VDEPSVINPTTLIRMCASEPTLVAHTMKQELMHSLSFTVDKKRRDIIEVKYPQFILKNFEYLFSRILNILSTRASREEWTNYIKGHRASNIHALSGSDYFVTCECLNQEQTYILR
jgi:hypothetical protein